MTAVTGSDRRTDDRYYTRIASTPALIERAEPTVWGGPEGGMFGAQELEAHERDGFVQVPQLLTAEEVAGYAAELDRLATDPAVRGDERCIVEKSSNEVRSIFEVHRISDAIARLVADERVAGRARQILGSDVYVHQSRINYKPGFGGGGFYWHSDFETWHAEDGMPLPRAVSCSISLTENFAYNGCLMIMPGSHRTFVSCVGETPEDHYRASLKEQEIGTPDPDSLTALADRHGIAMLTGAAGSATFFDSNCMHGSSDNISPYPRSNIFVVFNSVENTSVEPFYAPARRPDFIGARDFTPVPR
ncbi:ectoine hydroxylase [Pseudonocardia dioxanivorans CB1190]|uniref:Ectoine hydroxylase n=1 Tax=Pseudonocardia dioxanivorans (strain ATCC 55486 / DSM 44775 / JCM 13855 / CB1190) TaxID=675635 RepID=F4D1G0_PSEUX|nr:ectoine hydroxylase [Pseudonocardia dioxanivorans]AEA27948.1 ectoine hydroxylase [Pseudonocardia dioxanivorans CB1190]